MPACRMQPALDSQFNGPSRRTPKGLESLTVSTKSRAPRRASELERGNAGGHAEPVGHRLFEGWGGSSLHVAAAAGPAVGEDATPGNGQSDARGRGRERSGYGVQTGGAVVEDEPTFQERFCRVYHHTPARFEKSMFWLCLYPHTFPLALLIRWVRPRYFADDFELIRWLAGTRDLEGVSMELKNFQYSRRNRRSWLRRVLRVRLSGRKIMALADEVFSS